MSVQKSNVLIAEFLELDSYISEDKHKVYTIFSDNEMEHSEYRYDNSLEYHSNWEWLMSVIYKIETLAATVSIYDETCSIHTHKDLYLNGYNRTTLNKTKLSSTYRAVIDFIKWYNKATKHK